MAAERSPRAASMSTAQPLIKTGSYAFEIFMRCGSKNFKHGLENNPENYPGYYRTDAHGSPQKIHRVTMVPVFLPASSTSSSSIAWAEPWKTGEDQGRPRKVSGVFHAEKSRYLQYLISAGRKWERTGRYTNTKSDGSWAISKSSINVNNTNFNKNW